MIGFPLGTAAASVWNARMYFSLDFSSEFDLEKEIVMKNGLPERPDKNLFIKEN